MTLEQRLEDLASNGYCPCLLNDDNGKWALVFEGFQSLPPLDEKEDYELQSSFIVEKEFWKPTISEAVDYALEKLEV